MKTVVLILLALNLFSTAHADEAESILSSLHLEPGTSLYEKIHHELVSMPAWKDILNTGSNWEGKRYVRSILMSEAQAALKNANYPAKDFYSLYPFLKYESEKDKASSEVRSLYKELVPKYQAKLQDLDSIIDANLAGAEGLVSEKAFLKKLSAMPYSEQLTVFHQAFERTQDAKDVYSLYHAWCTANLGIPSQKPEIFFEYARFVKDHHAFPDGSENVLKMIKLNIQQYEGMSKLSTFQKLKAKWNGFDEKKLKAFVSSIAQYPNDLPASSRLYVDLVAKKSTSAAEGLARHISTTHSSTYQYSNDDLAYLIRDEKLDLNPKTTDRNSKALLEMLENSGNSRPLGPTVFAKLLDENPSLAKKLENHYLEKDFIPAFFGDQSEVKRAYYASFKENNLIEDSNDRILRYLKESDQPNIAAYRESIHDFLMVAPHGNQFIYNYPKNFERLLPFVQLDDPDAAKFIYHFGSPERMSSPEKYYEQAKKYLNQMADDPAKLMHEIYAEKTFFFSKIEKEKFLQNVYHGDSEGLKKFTLSMLNTVDEVLKNQGNERLGPREFTAMYDHMLRTLVTDGKPTPQEFKTAYDQFKQSLAVPARDAKTSYYARITQRRVDFDQWYFNETKKPVIEHFTEQTHELPSGKVQNCDFRPLLNTIAIQN